MSCSVVQLIAGRGGDDPRGVTGSVSLARRDDLRILIDAGDPWNGSEIIAELRKLSLCASDVTHVIITHGHVDHCANLLLFPFSTIIMDSDFVKKQSRHAPPDYSTIEEFPFQLSENIKIHKLRGHTHSDLLVEIFEEDGSTTMVCGDLIESETDDGMELAVDKMQLEESQRFIFSRADFIVPGHGKMFKSAH
ncbi:unnamed protein product [Caenorhabditis bovis]|uniref:Metallo-beta-lactamase domain-containing protein n=1 Tax=Caenorhabditis bovis TaxID=2654633 RepID=A0A8S1EU58_9PELO|nr:unnamed protein product [Caenorhabditis bovis]